MNSQHSLFDDEAFRRLAQPTLENGQAISEELRTGFTTNTVYGPDSFRDCIARRQPMEITSKKTGVTYSCMLCPGTLSERSVNATVVGINGQRLLGDKLTFVNENGRVKAEPGWR